MLLLPETTARPPDSLPCEGNSVAFGNRQKVAPFAEMRRLVWLHWFLIAFGAFIVTKVMWAPALLWGHSAWMDFIRMVEFDAAIRAGDYWPSWSSDLYHGYGSPLFQFYSPLIYFISEIPLRAGMDIGLALKVTQLSVLIASGVTMYHLAAAHVSRWAACFGAMLYMIAPYRMADIFVRHALAEHAAFAWLPLLVWGTQQFVESRKRAGLIAALFASAGLLLTHNITALIGLPLCVSAGWLLSAREKNWRTFSRAGYPTALGIGLASFFWWPALRGRVFTQAEESLTSGHFDYHNHFLMASDVPWQIGLPHLLLGAAVACLIFTKWRTRWSVVGCAFMTTALVMCHAISLPFWDALPLLKYVQFPWRFLGLAVFGAAICGAALIHQLRATNPRWELPAFVAGSVAIMTLYFPNYTNANFLAGDSQTNSFVETDSVHVQNMRASGRLLSLDQIVTPAQIRLVGERATSSNDFLPSGVEEGPTEPAAEPISTIGGKIVHSSRLALNRYRAELLMREPGKVELHQFWFPGWRAWIDGREIETSASGKMAIVSCDVPAGTHVVEFKYSGLPQRRTGIVISAISLIVAAFAIFRVKILPGVAA